MMCYRGRTFCPFWMGCKLGSECSLALTSEVQAAAKEWWGSDEAPICTYVTKPTCFIEEDK